VNKGLIEKKYEMPLLAVTIFSVAMSFWALNEKTQFAYNVYLLVGVALMTALILMTMKEMEIGYIAYIALGSIFYPLFLLAFLGFSDLGQKIIHFKIFDFKKKKQKPVKNDSK